jgi:signal transduction histidine kinase
MANRQSKFAKIKQYLLMNADPIEKEATRLHKKFLGAKYLRSDYLAKYQNNHLITLKEIAAQLDHDGIALQADRFRELGTLFAKESVADGLTLEEAVDGTIFLKQALWQSIKKGGLLKELTLEEYFMLSQRIGTYIDILTSKLAFTYHNELQYVENSLRYLAEASKILSSSLDYQTTLNTVAELAVPQIADWCAVDILDSAGKLQQVALAHRDPKKVAWAKKLREKQPVDMNAPTGVPNVLRTGRSEIYPIITDEMLVSLAKNKKELELARSIGFTSVMIVPIISHGKSTGAITFVTTETERHYNQADLLMAEELGTRASVAIENATLYKGSKEAISLRDEFISVASHELKTPVTSVKMFTQVLRKHSEQIGDAKAVNHLSKMDKQINRLTELIYDLLNISKIQAGKMEFKQKTFDFDSFVREMIDVLQQSEEKHRLVIKGRTGKIVFGDEERIGQVINNLISNAVKYSPKADKVIIRLTANDDTVTLSVEDFGIGMEKEHLSRIFERFYRVYDTTDKTFPGLGIGLYISSEIIRRHNGSFHVDSHPGKGSVFSFSLPVWKGKAD